MVGKLIYNYFKFLDWLNLFRSGCLKEHSFEYLFINSDDKKMFFEYCNRCHYTQGISEYR